VKDKLYLTTGKNPKGDGLLAVISYGQPQRGDKEVTALTLEIVDNQAEAEIWFRQMKIEKPWLNA